MKPQTNWPAVLINRLLFWTLLCLTLVWVLQGPAASSFAQENDERVFEDRVPRHVPIRIKLKKEKERSFKDLRNEKWLEAFEIEVTNIGDKPIYFLDLLVVLPDVKVSGLDLGYPLRYGRRDLISFKVRAEPTDDPLEPGETHVFSLANQQRVWDMGKRNFDRPLPKRVQVKLRVLNFGDGTGFMLGVDIPNVRNKRRNDGRSIV